MATENVLTVLLGNEVWSKGTAETAPHCILNKQMISDSSYIICSFSDFNWSIESLATFGLAQYDAVYVNTRQM